MKTLVYSGASFANINYGFALVAIDSIYEICCFTCHVLIKLKVVLIDVELCLCCDVFADGTFFFTFVVSGFLDDFVMFSVNENVLQVLVSSKCCL